MKITREKNLYQLTSMPHMFPVNCYLLEEESELTLIDTGIPTTLKGIQKLIDTLEKPLTNILLTHPHSDHVGSLDALKRLYPQAIVSISERDHLLLKGDTSLLKDEPQIPIKGGIPKNIDTVPDRLLKDGDYIGSLQAIAAPGHTPGSFVFFEKLHQVLIAGDAFQTRGGAAVSGQIRPLFPFPAIATWSRELALESAIKLKDLKPKLLAVGHGKMIQNPGTTLQKIISDAEKNLEKYRERK